MKFNISKFKISNSESGFVISIVTFFVLIIVVSIALSMSSLVFYQQRSATNSVKSSQSYYTAQAGAEEALLRLRNNPFMPGTSYTMNVNNTTATVTIHDIVGVSRTINSQGNDGNSVRKIQVVYGVNSSATSFHYGVQVGIVGLQMNNGSEIKGNVFSDGTISGSGTIDNNAIIASNGNSINGVHIKGSAWAYNCMGSTIDGNLTYVQGGVNNCTVLGSTSFQSSSINSEPLPISQSQIDQWKTDASNGGVIMSDYNVASNQSVSLGPVKIMGSLNLGNSSVVTMKGTVYVLGNINFGNNDTIKLNGSYGSLSGVILLDGSFNTGNSLTLSGSGQSGSYILVLSTNSSPSAITISNNESGAIFYTSSGGIQVQNNVEAEQLTGVEIVLGNNAVVNFNNGITNTLFTSGPSSGWKVISWTEQ